MKQIEPEGGKTFYRKMHEHFADRQLIWLGTKGERT